jgi:hypothetical protein
MVLEDVKNKLIKADMDNILMRQALWMLNPSLIRYGDDGEMQVDGCDYRRAPVEALIRTTTLALQQDIERRNQEYATLGDQKRAVDDSFDQLAELIGWTQTRCSQDGSSPFDCARELIKTLHDAVALIKMGEDYWPDGMRSVTDQLFKRDSQYKKEE